MAVRQSETLTATQQNWLKHLHCCQVRSQSLSANSKAEGLDLKSLYNWRYRLKKKGVLEDSSVETTPLAPRFQKVVVAPEPICSGEVRLRWPNGFVLEFECGVDPGYVKRLVDSLGVIG